MGGLPACSSNEDGEACGWGGLGEMGSAGFVCLFPCDLEEKEWFPTKTLNIMISLLFCTHYSSALAAIHHNLIGALESHGTRASTARIFGS